MNKSYKLEKYEWDSTWMENTDESNAKRILYIGDSISCGIRTFANKLSNGKILFDGYGTSKALDNPYFFKSLEIFANQEKKINAVIFNNGLHGWHLKDDEYKNLYEEFLENLLRKFNNIPVIPILTTFVKDGHNERVIIRNEIVKKIAREKKLDIIDLYTVSEKNNDLLSDDKLHFIDKGYEILAKEVADYLSKKI